MRDVLLCLGCVGIALVGFIVGWGERGHYERDRRRPKGRTLYR